jgi:hypothetical protein
MSNNTPVLPVQTTRTSVTAIISLIAGILGLLAFFTGVASLLSLTAVITGHISKNEIKKNAGVVTGNGLATGGLITGYIGLALGLCICLIFALSFFGLFTIPFLTLPWSSGTSY